MINVTKSIVPDLKKYVKKLEKIWETRWMTNNGEYVIQLEKELEKRFETNCVLVSNGTLALTIALELFDFPKGSEIIVTPFTFVATVSTIIWQGYKPIFVDINSKTYNIDSEKIEKKITKNTVAILGVHVFGNPCEIDKIDKIAKKYNLRVIYDAAHCFDVIYHDKSIYHFGDVSMASFHATKVFHTIEGGAVFSNNIELIKKARRLRNFGFNEQIQIQDVGINAKMNEFQAAMGLLNLEIIDDEIGKRERITAMYKEQLKDLEVEFQQMNPHLTKYNYIYMPVLFKTEKIRDKIYQELKEKGYNTRKYFYPSLSKIFSKISCPISESVSSRILQLPLYGELEEKHVIEICSIIKDIIEEEKL